MTRRQLTLALLLLPGLALADFIREKDGRFSFWVDCAGPRAQINGTFHNNWSYTYSDLTDVIPLIYLNGELIGALDFEQCRETSDENYWELETFAVDPTDWADGEIYLETWMFKESFE